ncbi:pyridoxamine 5'-phosphate oxidase [Alphaproteobacteria bacterium]|jgi:pyridoxamine 5'-phosphate oxidase|nr:pyridoxamine 5'-phosphate oxidase [Alphaproteobacteria bacterium]
MATTTKDLNDPVALFARWFTEAQSTEVNDAGAMALATYDPSQKRISNRIVFLRGFNEAGFVFYTHIDSPKSNNLIEHPNAALTVHWKSSRRQIRIEGNAMPVADVDVCRFFSSRPEKSQLDIFASKQSKILSSRKQLFDDRAAIELLEDRDVRRRPRHWCGYRVIPDRIEFWASDREAMHDRFIFVRKGETWVKSLLYP